MLRQLEMDFEAQSTTESQRPIKIGTRVKSIKVNTFGRSKGGIVVGFHSSGKVRVNWLAGILTLDDLLSLQPV